MLSSRFFRLNLENKTNAALIFLNAALMFLYIWRNSGSEIIHNICVQGGFKQETPISVATIPTSFKRCSSHFYNLVGQELSAPPTDMIFKALLHL